MTLQILFLLIAAFAVFIVVPIALVMSAIENFRHTAGDRPSSGIRIPIVPFRVIRG